MLCTCNIGPFPGSRCNLHHNFMACPCSNNEKTILELSYNGVSILFKWCGKCDYITCNECKKQIEDVYKETPQAIYNISNYRRKTICKECLTSKTS